MLLSMMTPKQFRKRLIAKRREGMTLEAIAKELGVTKQAASLWSRGKDPSKPVLLLADSTWKQSKKEPKC